MLRSTRKILSLALAMAFGVGLLGCNDGRGLPLPAGADGGSAIDTGEPETTVPPTPSQGTNKLDVLFVIDNSGSMQQEQQALTAAFPTLLARLRDPLLGADASGLPCTSADRRGCRLPDLRVGVVSTDLGAGNYSLPSCEVAGGDGGKLQTTPRVAGCTAPSDPWIAYDPKTDQTNVKTGATKPLERAGEAFRCIAELGIGGCGFESPLEAARRALDPKLAVNAGFLRADARLLVVFITDEDDCSAANPQLFDPAQQGAHDPLGALSSFRCFEFGVTCDINDRTVVGPRTGCKPSTQGWLKPVSDYVAFFGSLKPIKGQVQLAMLAGPTTPVAVGQQGGMAVLQPSCQSANGLAVPPLRLQALVDAFGGTSASICDSDYKPALEQIAAAVWR